MKWNYWRQIGRIGSLLACLPLTIFLLGCAPLPPSSAAISAKLDAIASNVQSHDSATLAGIQVDPEFPDSSALIVIPDQYRLQMVVRSALRGRSVPENILESLARLEVVTLTTQANALVKSQTFGSNSVTILNDTLQPDMGTADYLVWFQVRSLMPDDSGPWVGHWFVRRAWVTRIASAFVDPGTPPGTPRLESFIHSVKSAVDRLNSVEIPPGPRTPT